MQLMPQHPKLLVVDDDPQILDLIERFGENAGFDVESCPGGREALDRLAHQRVDVAVIDLRMPDVGGLEVLRAIREIDPDCQTILMSGGATIDNAVEAVKLGAVDCLTKPFDFNRLKSLLADVKKEAAQRGRLLVAEQEMVKNSEFCGMVGRSPVTQELFALIRRLAPHVRTSLITGETGVGKELVARALYQAGPRRHKKFVAINCSAIAESLFESELFGHTKGAFTGATDSKAGVFEFADGGTIFLDEIGDTSPAMQVKLLRVLQERQIRRVGGTEQLEVDVRIITATNQDLESMVREKRFREDLYYRINVIAIKMPPLREKREDLAALANHFLGKYNKIMGKRIREIAPDAMRQLMEYNWPGNVRELENVIERAVALEGSDRILPASFNREVVSRTDEAQPLPVVLNDGGIDLETQLERLRERFMNEALSRTQGVQTRAAELLGMSFRSFRYFAKKYNLMESKEPKEGFGR
jgi:two-component system response regulator PilR (NtrC family)